MDLGLSQPQLARQLVVSPETILHWEKDQTRPFARHLSRIWDFLGEVPEAAPDDFPAQVRLARQRRGLTQDQLAELLGIDPSTVWRWERGKGRPFPGLVSLLENRVPQGPPGRGVLKGCAGLAPPLNLIAK